MKIVHEVHKRKVPELAARASINSTPVSKAQLEVGQCTVVRGQGVSTGAPM